MMIKKEDVMRQMKGSIILQFIFAIIAAIFAHPLFILAPGIACAMYYDMGRQLDKLDV